MKRFFVFCFVILLFVFISGCTSDTAYQQPSTVPSAPTLSKTPAYSAPAITQTQKAIVKSFNIGESATDDQLKVTLNSAKYMDKITYSSSTSVNGQSYTSNMDFPAKAGYKFLILDISIENLLPDKTQRVSELLSFKVSDADGYSYPYSFYTAYLDRKFEGGEILPGQKKRGSAAFEVPNNPNGLQFNFIFDLSGPTAVYKIN
jgi:hypothetical protein